MHRADFDRAVVDATGDGEQAGEGIPEVGPRFHPPGRVCPHPGEVYMGNAQREGDALDVEVNPFDIQVHRKMVETGLRRTRKLSRANSHRRFLGADAHHHFCAFEVRLHVLRGDIP